MDTQELIRRCRECPQIKSAVQTDKGVEVVVRGNIVMYDDYERSTKLESPMVDAKTKAVLSRLPEIEQEHKFLVGDRWVRLLWHTPVGAFGNPFSDLGVFEFELRCAAEDSDYDELINLMVCETCAFNVLDIVMVEKLVEWANKT